MAQGENVEYTLSLRDYFTGKLKEAEGAAKGFETTIGGIGLAIAGAFSAAAIGTFVSSSVQAFSEAEKASAQLTASLKSTGAESWITKEALDAQALALMRMSTFDDDAITGAQSLLLTFTNVRDAVFEQAMPAITDLATKMGTDLNSATMQVGKALNDPIQGLTALRRVGVSFSEQQQKMIKDMQQAGDMAGAQALILKELNKEFGGSAQADASTYAGQMAILRHEYMNVKEEVGMMVAKLLIELKPAIEKIINGLGDFVKWLKDSEAGLKGVATFIGVATIAYGAYVIKGALATFTTQGLATAMWNLTAAMAANPIGIVITAVAALAGAMVYAYNKSATFRGVIQGVWEVMKGFFRFIMATGSGALKIIQGLLNPGRGFKGFKEGLTEIKAAWKDFDPMGDFNKGYTRGSRELLDAFTKEEKTAKPPGSPPDPDDPLKPTPKASSVTGQKVYTINISIDSLVKEFKVHTTNITEGAAKAKEIVAQALMGAVNDSQIIAER